MTRVTQFTQLRGIYVLLTVLTDFLQFWHLFSSGYLRKGGNMFVFFNLPGYKNKNKNAWSQSFSHHQGNATRVPSSACHPLPECSTYTAPYHAFLTCHRHHWTFHFHGRRHGQFILPTRVKLTMQGVGKVNRRHIGSGLCLACTQGVTEMPAPLQAPYKKTLPGLPESLTRAPQQHDSWFISGKGKQKLEGPANSDGRYCVIMFSWGNWGSPDFPGQKSL